ncbi:hypothetical protein FEP58_03832 [Burkholderia multivorans]|nr:hypothetical protein [Burkholderia multivorans]
MSWYAKVAWQEGLFFRPQLFQQQERYFERYAHMRAAPLSPFFFGFVHYALDLESLALGKVIVKSAAGVFADGTPFDAPGNTPLPPPLTVRPEHLDQVIYLAVPVRLPNCEETTFEDTPDSMARYQVFDAELRDSNSVGLAPESVQLSNLRLRLVPEKELGNAWIGLALTSVKTIRADGSIELDDTIVPPVSGYGASDLLTSWVTKIHDLAHLRANALSQRLAGTDDTTASAATVTDYLLLQILNRYEPLLQHMLRVPTTSPAEVYTLLIAMAGELSTHLRTDTRRPLDTHPPYRHTTPHLCLKPLVDDTHRLLNAVLVRSAQSIALEDRGARHAQCSDRSGRYAGFRFAGARRACGDAARRAASAVSRAGEGGAVGKAAEPRAQSFAGYRHAGAAGAAAADSVQRGIYLLRADTGRGAVGGGGASRRDRVACGGGVSVIEA